MLTRFPHPIYNVGRLPVVTLITGFATKYSTSSVYVVSGNVMLALKVFLAVKVLGSYAPPLAVNFTRPIFKPVLASSSTTIDLPSTVMVGLSAEEDAAMNKSASYGAPAATVDDFARTIGTTLSTFNT